MTQEIVTRDPVRELVASVRGDQFKAQVALALPEGVKPERFVRVMVTALLDNPDLALRADQTSIFQAGLHCAKDGLLPDGREAAFVLFGSSCAYLPMIGGMRKIAAEFGWSLRTQVVYENDEFDYALGMEPVLNHRPVRPGMARGKMIAAYAIGTHRDHPPEMEVLTTEEIEKVRATSRAKDRGPWKDWYERMAEKTAGRRLFAKLPLGERDRARVASVLDADDRAPGEAAALLYGPPAPEAAANGERRQIEAGEPEASEQSHAETSDGSASAASESEPDFDGEEPVEGEVVEASFKAPSGAAVEENPDVLAANAAGALGFTSGKWKGKTIAEVAASGDDGLGYIEWALRSWKTDPLKSAVWDYAKIYAPDLFQKVMAQRETSS